jgi:uncharacterized protein YqeY
MTLEKLQSDMIAARKSANKARVSALTNMIDTVKKASLTPKGRVEITEQLVNESLIKYQKIVQEQYDTCPNGAEYMERKSQYCKELEIVKEYAPQLITDTKELKIKIEEILDNLADQGIGVEPKNRGVIMKTVMSELKGKADLKVAQSILKEVF